MTELEDISTLEKDANANMDFSLAEGNNGICIDGIYGRQYPLIMLKNNQPMFFVESSKLTVNEPSVRCDNIFDYAHSNDVLDGDAPLQSLTDE
jgi:hypothetical protein